MTTPIQLVFAGNSVTAQQAIDALEKKYDILEKKIKGLQHSQKSTFQGPLLDVEKMIGAVGKLALQYVSVQGAINLATRAWEDQRERMKDAAQSQEDVAPKIQSMLRNTSGSKYTENERVAIAQKISVDKRVKGGVGVVADAISKAASGAGNLPEDDIYSAVEAAAGWANLDSEAIPAISDALLSVKKRRPELSNRVILGYFQKWFKESRSSSVQDFSQNVLPGIISMAGQGPGQDIEGSAAILNALGQVTGDPHGRRDATAGIAWVMQAREFWGRKETADMTNPEVMALFHNDKKARDLFLYGEGAEKGGRRFKGMKKIIADQAGAMQFTSEADRAEFQKRSFQGIVELMTPGTPGYLTLQEYLKDRVTPRSGEEALQQFEAGQKTVPILERAGERVQQQNEDQASNLESDIEARWDTAYEKIIKTRSAGVSWLNREYAQWGLYFRKNIYKQLPEEAAAAQLKWLQQGEDREAAMLHTDPRERAASDITAQRLRTQAGGYVSAADALKSKWAQAEDNMDDRFFDPDVRESMRQNLERNRLKGMSPGASLRETYEWMQGRAMEGKAPVRDRGDAGSNELLAGYLARLIEIDELILEEQRKNQDKRPIAIQGQRE